MKCSQCGSHIKITPPALWLGNSPSGQPVVRFLCMNGHPTDMQLATIKPMKISKTTDYPPERGKYFHNLDLTQFCCPICCCIFGLGTGVHTIAADGVVKPSVVCPQNCGFHSEITLLDWKP